MSLKETALSLFLFFSSLLTQNLYGQEKEIILLNQHFYPTEESDRDSYFYKAIKSKDVNGNIIERIFTPSNQLVRITRFSFNEKGQFNQ